MKSPDFERFLVLISQEIHRALAPTGTLRAGINLSNFLLVSGRNADGTPAGVSPDLARHIARVLDVHCQFVTFDTPGELADAAAGALSHEHRQLAVAERNIVLNDSRRHVHGLH